MIEISRDSFVNHVYVVCNLCPVLRERSSRCPKREERFYQKLNHFRLLLGSIFVGENAYRYRHPCWRNANCNRKGKSEKIKVRMNESMRVCRASVRVREWYESVN